MVFLSYFLKAFCFLCYYQHYRKQKNSFKMHKMFHNGLIWRIGILTAAIFNSKMTVTFAGTSILGRAVLKVNVKEEMIVRDKYKFKVDMDPPAWRMEVIPQSGDETREEIIGTKDGKTIARLVRDWNSSGATRDVVPVNEKGSIDIGHYINDQALTISKCIYLQWIANPKELKANENLYFKLTEVPTAPADGMRMSVELNSNRTAVLSVTGYAPSEYILNGGIGRWNSPFQDGYAAWSLNAIEVNSTGYIKKSIYKKSGPFYKPNSGAGILKVLFECDFDVDRIIDTTNTAWLPKIASDHLVVQDNRWNDALTFTNSIGTSVIAFERVITNRQWDLTMDEIKLKTLKGESEVLRKASRPVGIFARALIIALLVSPLIVAILRVKRENSKNEKIQTHNNRRNV